MSFLVAFKSYLNRRSVFKSSRASNSSSVKRKLSLRYGLSFISNNSCAATGVTPISLLPSSPTFLLSSFPTSLLSSFPISLLVGIFSVFRESRIGVSFCSWERRPNRRVIHSKLIQHLTAFSLFYLHARGR